MISSVGADEFLDRLFWLLETRGGGRYDESVSQLEHALQAAELARAELAPPALVVAALLHDIGHLVLDERGERLEGDAGHERAGARLLHSWFPPAVVVPVALHVSAKRYLVAADPGYAAALSPASQRSLVARGGPFGPDAAVAFAALGHATAAIAVRRWDDRAKVPGIAVPPLADFRDAVRADMRPASGR
jgi:phosphonate degradation associated HDIG domain protein